MKLRAQRVHHMGSSNRQSEVLPFCTKNVFETSYVKSHSSYYNKTAHSLPPAENQQAKTANPFKGTHNEMETMRWNSKAKRGPRQHKWHLQPALLPIDYSSRLNEQVANVTEEFKGKDINLFKLNQLKRTFVKNNKNRKQIKEYFDRFAKQGKIGIDQLQDIVQEYGYDINQDEAKIIFRLTGAQKNNININQFIELMSRENVHFSTLKLEGVSGQPRKHFQQRIHLVIKNKFKKLNEAFKIYRMRKEPIDQEKYQYVMKKLDINDLVITKAQRQNLFQKFKSKDGHFNAEALMCAIIEQQYTHKPTYPPKLSNYDTNLKVHDQAMAKQEKKTAYFDFKRTNTLQFESQMSKAQQIVRQIKKLGAAGQKIFEKKGGALTRQQFLKQSQNLLRQNGINFTPEQYSCFSSYFDYNNSQQITKDQFVKCLQETNVKAEQRFDRRLRAPAPLEVPEQPSIFDQNLALTSIERIKNVHFDPQAKTVFKDFDKDKDGYISRSQFKQKINKLAVLQGWQVQNLVNYFDDQGKGFVNYDEFSKKFDNNFSKTDLNFDREPLSKLKSHSDWLSTKKSYIKQTNNHVWNIPSKYSAWPERLRHTDLSLIQPPSKAGQFMSEQQRFNSTEKHNMGQQHRQQKLRTYQNKLRKLTAWNELNQQRIQFKQKQHQNRCQANDYSMRLTKQIYEQRCHNPI